MAKRLHRAIETYTIPKTLKTDKAGRLSPIFRDVEELSAHYSLSEKIKNAIQNSSFLIVLCSPAAKQSRWVNEEIRLFRKLHGDDGILSVLIDGEPESAFPEALIEGGREPLAANMQGGRDGFRFGINQLAASLLGVGLDQLVKRDQRRRRIRAQIFLVTVSMVAMIMSGMAYVAFDARNAARESRNDAERLVEYMISDLKSELHGLQRLDILDGLGDEIVDYYEGIDPKDLPDERLTNLITAIQSLSEVSIEEENFDKAERYLTDASDLIKVLEDRNSESDEAIFYRAQNEYWTGLIFKRQDKFLKALPYWEEYNRLGQKLYQRDPDNIDWAMEAGWGASNLAILYRFLDNYEQSRISGYKGMKIFKPVYEKNPDDLYIAYEYANVISTASMAEFKLENRAEAIELGQKQLKIIERVLDGSKVNFKALHYRNQTKYRLLAYQDIEICGNGEYSKLLDEAFSLVEYETGNSRWRDEYTTQWGDKIASCLKSDPNQISDEDIKAYIEYYEKTAPQAKVNKFKERVKKLRTINPESLD
ncbi:MAG: toll/interleukin-1 receptor domain-containing protein [Hellea sp.]|nr:toll/interleukin-1 receptor domain-containing protein [Hellea sp.]